MLQDVAMLLVLCSLALRSKIMSSRGPGGLTDRPGPDGSRCAQPDSASRHRDHDHLSILGQVPSGDPTSVTGRDGLPGAGVGDRVCVSTWAMVQL